MTDLKENTAVQSREISKNPTINSSKKHMVYLDVVRIIAIFFVIFIHTADNGVALYSCYAVNAPQYWIYGLFTIVSDMAVPLFFMVSGALLLPRKEEALGFLWKKRILKFALLLLIYSILYYISEHFLYEGLLSPKEWACIVYSSQVKAHLWYLYAYLAYLIILPFLRTLALHSENRHFKYLIVLALVYSCFSVLEAFFGDVFTLNSNIKISALLASNVFYPLVGYYLAHRVSSINAKTKAAVLWGGTALSLLISLCTTYLRYRTGSKKSPFSAVMLPLLCMAVFFTVKIICEKHPFSSRVNKAICCIGSCTFGIYLVHMVLLDLPLFRQVLSFLQSMGTNPMIAVWIYIFCIAFVSFVITFVMKKIPIIKKLVGG